MSRQGQRTVERFRKKGRVCNICQLQKDLSEDHVPPQACPPVKSRIVSKLSYQLLGDKSFKPRISQNGVYYKTICKKCNSDLGGKYDKALSDFSRSIERFIESEIVLPQSFELECQPNAIMRSILGHLLAAKTEDDDVIIDSLIRPSVLDESVPIHDDVHVFYWVYPFEKTIIFRDFGMPAIRGDLNTVGFFNMIKFYPVSFLITHQLSDYEGLQSLHRFNNTPLNDRANVRINLSDVRRSTWPEECLGTENVLYLGRAANDSAFSLPRSKIIKTK